MDTTLTIRVDGMTCGGCENAVRSAIGRIPGVAQVSADHTTGEVVVTVSAPVDRSAVEEAVTGAGFALG